MVFLSIYGISYTIGKLEISSFKWDTNLSMNSVHSPFITIPEFTKERYLSRVAKARALVPLREKFAHFLFSSYLFFYFLFHLLCYISVSHKVCSFQWCQKFDMLHWEIKIGSQNGDSEWLCKIQPYLRVQTMARGL